MAVSPFITFSSYGLGRKTNRQRFKSIYSLYVLISYISLSYLFFGVWVFSFVKWDKYYLWYRIIDTPINQSTPININKYLPSVLQRSLGISFLINHHLFMSNSGFSFYLCVCVCSILHMQYFKRQSITFWKIIGAIFIRKTANTSFANVFFP